jgi:molybdopterin-guanine dinucleotide biosynthesis protein A
MERMVEAQVAVEAETGVEAGASSRRRGSRLGSVAGALRWQGCSQPSATARLLDGLFEEVLLVGGRPTVAVPGRRLPQPEGPDAGLRALEAALAATDAERVVYVPIDGPSLTVDLLLALTAWPEADAVVVGDPADDAAGDSAPPLCAIHRRAVCLEAARARIAAGRRTLQDLFDSVETTRISLARLGIAETDAEPPTHSRAPDDRARLEGR